MAGYRLELPTIQNWNCHSCSGCCRQHVIQISDEERQRILEQRWSNDQTIGPGQPTVVADGGPPWNRHYRLAHQANGDCVFLDENGLCRIHAKFGEQAKPLACQIYPYTFHPSGKKVAVSLRFSCPSVVANRGKPIADQRKEIKKLAQRVVPERSENNQPPEISPGQRVDWADFGRFIDALETILTPNDAPITVRLLRALHWIELVDKARFNSVRGARLGELLEILCEAAHAETPHEPQVVEPSKLAQMQFRLLAAQYARKDTAVELVSGWRNRWKLLRAAIRVAVGKGRVPPLQECFRDVSFSVLEQPFGGLPDHAEELFTRYFRVKIRGIHFCGRAYYGTPLVEGFQSLALIFPATLWLARWLAAGAERSALEDDDVARALAIADHHHGFSPAFGRRNFRTRVRTLARMGEVDNLCAWYSR